jgi:CBS domain containing-hemolysin-like protein
VGEVVDEHDVETSRARPDGDGAWVLAGLLRPDEVAAGTGVQLPEHPSYETVAGLVLRELGRLPDLGDTAVVTATTDELDDDGLPVEQRAELRVDGMDGLRIEVLHLRLLGPVGDTGSDDDDERSDR